MSQLKVNSIVDASGGSNAQLYGVASPPNSMGFRNRIINGDMRIDQRNNGASVAVGAGTYNIDRFQTVRFGGSATMTQQRTTVAPSGFVNSLGFTVGTAASPGATDQSQIYQFIEGNNVSDLGWGTANAQTITLSFWVRSSVTGTFGVGIRNGGANRAYVASYSISSANTWEYKTVTIPGDTSGTWATDNTAGLVCFWDLGVGSTYSQSSGSWQANASIAGLTGGTKLIATAGATFYITGVQLEAGTVASPFERRDYGRELMMCQRYARRVGGDGTNIGYAGNVLSDGGNTFYKYDQNPVEMRSTVSITTYLGSYRNSAGNPTTNQWALSDVAAGARVTWGTAPTFIALASNDTRYVNFYSNNGATPSISVVGRGYEYVFGPTAYIILSSEL